MPPLRDDFAYNFASQRPVRSKAAFLGTHGQHVFKGDLPPTLREGFRPSRCSPGARDTVAATSKCRRNIAHSIAHRKPFYRCRSSEGQCTVPMVASSALWRIIRHNRYHDLENVRRTMEPEMWFALLYAYLGNRIGSGREICFASAPRRWATSNRFNIGHRPQPIGTSPLRRAAPTLTNVTSYMKTIDYHPGCKRRASRVEQILQSRRSGLRGEKASQLRQRQYAWDQREALQCPSRLSDERALQIWLTPTAS